ncbi:hypothetical protein D3OALGB2SA_1695 [Olavius algarvensis associated proteobacterium Delta 3]|nr:hypothetical protein D3OALGB2SA_1695 [Olavius algarvensis associated proteobacterium Delta 3]
MTDLLSDYPFRGRISFSPLLRHMDDILSASDRGGLLDETQLRHCMEEIASMGDPVDESAITGKHRRTIEDLLRFVLSSFQGENEAVAAVIPFSLKPVYTSASFRRLFLESDDSYKGRIKLDGEDIHRSRALQAYLFILETVYGIRQDFDHSMIHIVPDPNTGLDRIYRMFTDYRFVDIRTEGNLPSLDKSQLHLVQEKLAEPEMLKQILPPENFSLNGLTVFRAVEVTESELITELSRDLIDLDSLVSTSSFLKLQDRLRTLFRKPDLIAGIAALHNGQVLLLNSGSNMEHRCIFSDTTHVPMERFSGSPYQTATVDQRTIRIPDKHEDSWFKHDTEGMAPGGVRSMMIVPLVHKGTCIGTLDMATPEPGDFRPMDSMLVERIQPLFAMAVKKALDDLESSIQATIKEKCTAIHPSVEWRFRHAALHHFERLRMGQVSEMEDIVFRDVYPLYGISDIRGSTSARNLAIAADLSKQLELALEVVRHAAGEHSLLILGELDNRISDRLARLRSGMESGDELATVQFLQSEIETHFPLLESFGPATKQAIETYRDALDPTLGAIYRLRKEFEDSVSILNGRITAYLDQEEENIQALFPHYYERHRTDGVDYLIYAGESIVEEGGFSDLYLKNLRLWQIQTAVGIARLAEELKPSLKVPLEMAHLILVQDTPTNIRFRYDEKRFDVDGAYDVRNEIIKSRIDKATIGNGVERLTQPGKIAIVYTSPQEAEEMLRHIRFLAGEGYLEDDAEQLDLDELPGVQGLKAIRVSAQLASSAAAYKRQEASEHPKPIPLTKKTA